MMRSYSRSSSSASSSSENLPPRTLAKVVREIRDMITKPSDGTRLVVDRETGMPSSLSEIMAELEGPAGTPYASRYFQLKLVLSADFPNSPPRGFFLTKIYHPNVDMSTGAICVNTLKKDWSANVSLGHVLSIIRCLLIVPFPESSLNDEAGKLFMESYEEYARRAKLMADVHGRPHPYVDNKRISTPCSPKGAKENVNENDIKLVHNNANTGAVLKQSNSVDRNNNVGSTSKASGIMKSVSAKSGKSGNGGDKKSKKKSLRRL